MFFLFIFTASLITTIIIKMPTHDGQYTDEELMIAIKEDDYASYNQLFLRYYDKLCCYVFQLIQEKQETEDVVQEVFIYLWNHRKKIAIETCVSGYLYKMSKNTALNHIKSNNSYCTLLENQAEGSLYYEDYSLEMEEFKIALYDCINRLPSRSREVFLLHRVKGLKQKEISDQLSISIKTIKNQIWISLQKLKRCLEIKGVYE